MVTLATRTDEVKPKPATQRFGPFLSTGKPGVSTGKAATKTQDGIPSRVLQNDCAINHGLSLTITAAEFNTVASLRQLLVLSEI